MRWCLVLSSAVLCLATSVAAQSKRALRIEAVEDRFIAKATCTIEGPNYSKSFVTPKTVRLPVGPDKRFLVDRMTCSLKGHSLSLDKIPSARTRRVGLSFPKPGKSNLKRFEVTRLENGSTSTKVFDASSAALALYDARGKRLFFYVNDAKGVTRFESKHRDAVE